MKRISVIIIFTIFLFLPSAFAASDAPAAPSAQAGIAPDSRWYYFKIYLEDVWTGILSINPAAKIRYLNTRMEKRETEAVAMLAKKGISSQEFRKTLNIKLDHQHEILEILKEQKPEVYQDILTNQVGRNEKLQEAIRTAPAKAELETKINDARAKLAQARKTKDAQQADALLKELEKAKTDYSDLIKYQCDTEIVFDNANNKIEDYFTGNAKATLVAMRAAAEAERAKRDGDDQDMIKLNKLIAQAKQAVDDAKTKEAEDLAEKLQKAIHQTKENLNKKSAADITKQELIDKPVVVKAPAKIITPPITLPPPAPVKEKPVLETIPSETVSANPLVLLGFYSGLNGEVGKSFAVNFGGQGGLPPYHFKLETGIGFPPMGIILDTNGRLSGMPTAAGTFWFGVCVIDTAGVSKCDPFKMVVAAAKVVTPPAPVVPPPSPVVNKKITITNRQCVNSWVEITFKATGPKDTRLRFGLISGDPSAGCGEWTWRSSGLCDREAGNPDETTITFKTRATVGEGIISLGYDSRGNPIIASYSKACQ